ncbi:MAG: glycosyltransferase [Bacteroidetes bacterium]|nr:glycosyltransferase [Bacteroidota bacterium]
MHRICGSLSQAGYEVFLVGTKPKNKVPLKNRGFGQIRLNNWFSKGKLFYIEYNIRLFFFLLFRKMDAVCAIDLDTILPCLMVSRIKKLPRVYDAHELFCEMKEVVTRPFIYKCWKWVEKYSVPKFTLGYTVNGIIAEEFKKMYGVEYGVIRNIPVLREIPVPTEGPKYILYQGAVNEGRSFETLIPAMKWVDIPLIICGDGNFMDKAKALVQQFGLEEKIIFKGMVAPAELRQITANASIGITLFENKGKNNYYSLANRFFDYMHAGVPQICVDYPAYAELNQLHPFALLIDDLSPEAIAAALNNLLDDDVLYESLKRNCMLARVVYNWQLEEPKLLSFYHQLF